MRTRGCLNLRAGNRLVSERNDVPIGTRIGRYWVTRRVGSGAMGVVYEAFDPQLERRVALKLLRADALGRRRSVRDRLLREAQALAMVDHPNVVRVFDVGAVGNSLFVAMEFVAGSSGREWLRLRPNHPKVLDVFFAAGRGLAAIHGAGLVHRDFKPSNIVLGADGRVRVLDLGLARAAGVPTGSTDLRSRDSRAGPISVHPAETSGTLTRSGSALLQTPMTRTGAEVGTPPYMAPEQHRGRESDARADQFAFCVALYEALVGVRPFAGRSPDELAAAKRAGNVQPPPASAHVSTAIFSVLQRGLAVRPEHRYPSMPALLTALARARRGRRRHVGFAVGLCAAVGLGVVVHRAWPQDAQACDPDASRLPTVWYPARIDALRDRFDEARVPYAADAWHGTHERLDTFAREWGETWAVACEGGQHDAEDVRRHDLVSACLSARLDELDARLGALEQGDPSRTIEHAVLSAARLESPSRCLLDEARDAGAPAPPPELALSVEQVRREIEDAYALQEAGDFDAAIRYARAARHRAEELGWAPLLAEALLREGSSLDAAGHDAQARDPLREAAITGAAEGHDRVAAQAGTELAGVLADVPEGRADAERWLRRAHAAIERMGAPPELERTWLSKAATMDLDRDEPREAVEKLQRAASITRRLYGDRHPALARALDNLAIAVVRLGRLPEAQQLNREARDILEHAVGERHPAVGRSLINAGQFSIVAGEFEAAVEVYTRAVEVQSAAFGPYHEEVAFARDGMGYALASLGRHEEALDHQRRALAILEARRGPEHPSVATAHLSLGRSLSGLTRHAEALVHFRRGAEIFESAFGETHSSVAAAMNNIGVCRQQMGDLAGARDEYTRALQILQARTPPPQSEVARTLANLAMLSEKLGELPRARDDMARAVALLDIPHRPDPVGLARMKLQLGQMELELGNGEAATHMLSAALVELELVGAPDDEVALARLALDEARNADEQ